MSIPKPPSSEWCATLTEQDMLLRMGYALGVLNGLRAAADQATKHKIDEHIAFLTQPGSNYDGPREETADHRADDAPDA